MTYAVLARLGNADLSRAEWVGLIAAVACVFFVLQLARTRGPLTVAPTSLTLKIEALTTGAYRVRCQQCGDAYRARGGLFLELQRSPNTHPRWELARLPARGREAEPSTILGELERLLHGTPAEWKRLCSAGCMRAFLLTAGEPPASVEARFEPCRPCGELHVRGIENPCAHAQA